MLETYGVLTRSGPLAVTAAAAETAARRAFMKRIFHCSTTCEVYLKRVRASEYKHLQLCLLYLLITFP